MSLDIRRTWVQAHFHHRRKFSWMVSAALEIWEDAAERIPVCVCVCVGYSWTQGPTIKTATVIAIEFLSTSFVSYSVLSILCRSTHFSFLITL